MPSIAKDVVVHWLDIKPSLTTVQQKPKFFSPDKKVEMKEDVHKFLIASFIREVHYPTCLTNIIMEKKANDK